MPTEAHLTFDKQRGRVQDEPIRVLHAVTSIADEASGASYTVPRLARALAAQGHDATVVSLGELSKQEKFTKSRGTHSGLRVAADPSVLSIVDMLQGRAT